MTEPRRSVLVAEDNPAIAQVLRLNLHRAGFDVTVAKDGAEASEALSSRRFDLVFTDYMMPRVTGEELCRLIRRDPQHAGVPIVLCSAKLHELDIERLSAEVGLAHVFYKPFSPREIVTFVQSAFGGQPIEAAPAD